MFQLVSIKRVRQVGGQMYKSFRPYFGSICFIAILGFLSSVFEAIGINAFIPLVSFFVGGEVMGGGVISKYLQTAFGFVGLEFNLISVLVLIVVLFFAKAIVLLWFKYIQIKIRTKYEEDKMNTLFKKFLKSKWPYLKNQKIGYFENVLNTDVKKSASLIDVLAQIISSVTGLLVYLAVAINISQAVTLITLIFGGLIFLIFKPLLYTGRKISIEFSSVAKKISHRINEVMVGIKSIKAEVAEDEILNIGRGLFNKSKKLQVKQFLIQQVAVIGIQPLSVILIAVVVAFSFYQTSYNLGALIAIIYLIQKVFNYIQYLQSGLHTLNSRSPFMNNVMNYERESDNYLENIESKTGKKLKLNNSILFKDVSFSYKDQKGGQPVLKGINFEIKKGETIAFVGHSGSGKTTIFDLLLNFLSPDDGEILVDGCNINEFGTTDLRKKIGYVSQDIFLVNDSIRNNISFFNENVTNEDIQRALSLSELDDLVLNLPKGIDSPVGERGVMLSAGQRQRVALARALASKPEVLLLDEVTSALDRETEMNIHKSLLKLKGKITVLIVAHKLSTITDVDKILVLKNGIIIESGNPQELLNNKNTEFYKLYNLNS